MLPTAIKHSCPGLFYDLSIFLASSFGKCPAGSKDCGCVGSIPAAHGLLKVTSGDCNPQVKTWEVGKKPELSAFPFKAKVGQEDASILMPVHSQGQGLKDQRGPHLGRDTTTRRNMGHS